LAQRSGWASLSCCPNHAAEVAAELAYLFCRKAMVHHLPGHRAEDFGAERSGQAAAAAKIELPGAYLTAQGSSG